MVGGCWQLPAVSCPSLLPTLMALKAMAGGAQRPRLWRSLRVLLTCSSAYLMLPKAVARPLEAAEAPPSSAGTCLS